MKIKEVFYLKLREITGNYEKIPYKHINIKLPHPKAVGILLGCSFLIKRMLNNNREGRHTRHK